ncbi:hypothetical protein H2279_08235, partial [Campylobacter sp. B0100352/1]|uniref:hypothetical protein n=1 Tax=Campylobacter sp. B0100352/1 TaxID=2735783 RepID=UPI001E1334CF|nr:hypothetical protein [Campylobacter sp. B0100352/1]
MFISSKPELIQTIKNLINNEEVKQIDFIYPNFSVLNDILKNINFHQKKILFKKQILAMEILEILKQICDNHNDIEVNIHTLNELNAGQNINLKDLSSSEIYTKTYLKNLDEEIQDKKQGKDFNLFYYTDKNNLCIEFINTLKKIVKDSEDINTLEKLIENIDSDDISSEKFDDFKKKVLKKIESITESIFFKNNITPSLKSTYEKFIDELLEYIKKLAKEKEYKKIKIILSAIAGVVIATVVAALTGGTGLAIATAGLFSLMGSANEYYEFTQREYAALLTPLAAFLATRCAMFIHYINSRLLSCVLIVNKKEIIDLSGFGLYLGSDKSNIASNLAYKTTLNKEIESIESIFSEIFLEQRDKEHQVAISDSQLSNLSTPILTQKLSSLYLKNHSILENLQEDIKQFNYFSYIESPNFNSSKLAEFFVQKNQNAQIDLNTTKMSKNYLIISNIPSKYNAGLNESLTQEIVHNNIQDKYRESKESLDVSRKTYNSKRDYSEYSIEMSQDENEPYILQLSPFVKISKEAYKESKKAYEDMQDSYKKILNYNKNEPQSNNYPVEIKRMEFQEDFDKKLQNIKLYNYMYIRNFFKQNEEKESIIEKEKKLAYQYLEFLQEKIFKEICTKSKNIYGLKMYTFRDCLQIAWELYRAKQIFINLNLKFKKSFFGNINVEYLDEDYTVFSDDNCWIFEEKNKHNFSAIDFTQDLLDIFIESNKDNDENEDKNKKNNENIQKFFNELLKELTVELTDEELKQRFQKIYDKSFLEQKLEESRMELFSNLFWEAISSLVPLSNFFYHIKDPIKVFQKITNICITYMQKGFKEVLIEQLGLIYVFTTNPNIGIEIRSSGKNYFKSHAREQFLTIKEDFFQTKTKIVFMVEQIKNGVNIDSFSTIKANIEKHHKLDMKDEKLLRDLYNDIKSTPHVEKITIKTNWLQAKTLIKMIKPDLASMLAEFVANLALNFFFPTNFKALQEQYESIIYQLYTFKYDFPLAVVRDHFVTYPFAINSKFISF